MASNQKKIKFATKVFVIFSQAQKSVSVHKTHIFELVKFSQEDTQLFQYAFEQAYLKIFHSFNIKANKKIPAKFQTLAESFFEAILPPANDNGIAHEESKNWKQLFNAFLSLCTEGVYSSVMNIRIMCSRLLFQLIKLIPPKKMKIYLEQETQAQVMNSILHLLKTKVSTYRQLGIKLSSLILHLKTEKTNAIQRQLFKIMAVQENQQIRKLVITNLTITNENLDDILIRLRDKNPQIRSIVVKKLQGERFNLASMSVNHLYKLLYDGYGSKQVLVKKQCLRYFSMYFMEMQSEMEVQNKQLHFVKMFRPEILLLNPHLYSLFDELISDLLQQIEGHMFEYIRKICREFKSKQILDQIIWLKNASTSQSRQISKIYEQDGPSGLDLATNLNNLATKYQAFAIFQLLQLFGRQKMPDEIGRNKMFDSLKDLLLNLKNYEVRPDYTGFRNNDICHQLCPEELQRKKLMLSYYDMPIISTSFDMIYQIAETMKKLRPDHYENEMKEVMGTWYNPEQNILIKQKELIQMNLKKLKENNNDQRLYENMMQKHSKITNQLQEQNQKTRKVLMSISRLKHNCQLQAFMSITREQLQKQNKANGLLLLGLYCLQNKEKVSNFWGVFWSYIEQEDIQGHKKNHLLVSLKVVIDFIVKFNSLSGPFNPQGLEEFTADTFMDRMLTLLLHQDADIRILAIQSLCRLLYHQRIDKDNESTYFFYLILLWLETSTESISAKSVHTVSIFIKSYMEKGNAYVLKLAEIVCIFFKILAKAHEQQKGINKDLIKYNLTAEEFFKKVAYMLMTIFKYHKENRNVIWTYNLQESEIGPQQFILLFMFQEQQIMPMMGKALVQCDFYQFCSLETLILVKKKLQAIAQTRKWKGIVESSLKKLESQIQFNISSKNSEIFNEQAVQTMQMQFQQKMKLIEGECIPIYKNIGEKGLFVRLQDESDEQEEEDDENSQNLDSKESQDDNISQSQMISKSNMGRKKRVHASSQQSEEQEQPQDKHQSNQASEQKSKVSERQINTYKRCLRNKRK